MDIYRGNYVKHGLLFMLLNNFFIYDEKLMKFYQDLDIITLQYQFL